MAKKKKARPRLKEGDRVKVIKVPKKFSTLQKFVGKVGRVVLQRNMCRMWTVRFRKGPRMPFLRQELKKL